MRLPWRPLSVLLLTSLLGGCGGCRPGEVPEEGGANAVKKPAATAGTAVAVTPTRAPAVLPTARDLPTVEPKPTAQNQPQMAPPAAPPARPEDQAEDDEREEADCSVIVDAEPDYGAPPLTVHFTVDYECTEGGGVVSWDFGDNSTAGNEDNPTHTYRDAGEFTAVVTVTTPDGATATDEVDITVEAEDGAVPDVEPENP